ncbi:MAG: diguanylate cyclase [Burkholderiales bacterium]|nr:diguanylate cyclase [Burkholderiales bacterium]
MTVVNPGQSMQSGASPQTVVYVSHSGGCATALRSLSDAGYAVQQTDAAAALALAASAMPPVLLLAEWSDEAAVLVQSLMGLRRPNQAWVPLVACCADAQQAEAAIAAGADDFVMAGNTGSLRARLAVVLRGKARGDMLEGVLNATFDGIITIDAQGRMLTFNRAASRIFGYSPSEAIGQNVSMLMPEPERAQHDGHLRRYLATGEAHVVGTGRQVSGRRRSGEEFPLYLQVAAVRSGHEQLFVGIAKDRSLEAQADALRTAAVVDPVTGLGNRRHVLGVLQQWTQAEPGRVPRPFALLFVDLDGFKRVNDEHGHAAGDAVLRAVAGRLAHGIGREDAAGRLAGDEFVVLLHGVARAADAHTVARRLLAALAEPVQHGEVELHVTATAGVALCPRDGLSADTLLQHADAQMYRAKRGGPVRIG